MVGPGTFTELGTRSRRNVSQRLRRVRGTLLLALQAGVGAGLAWFIANDVFDRPHPFFAPIAAVIVLNVSLGQKLRRGVELLVGVATGILVGDAVIYLIGTGAAQIAFVVSLAIAVGAFLGGSPTLIGQAASSAVLVATLAPPTHGGIYYSRFIDTVIGGVTGLLVMVLLLQVNPLSVVTRATTPVLSAIADALSGTAAAIAGDDEEAAHDVLTELDAREPRMDQFHDRLDEARETSRLAPIRWHTRAPLARYVDAAPHIERAMHNARVLARRATSLIRDAEEVSPDLVASIRAMAEAIRVLDRELASGHEPVRTQELTVAAVVLAGLAYRAGAGFHSAAIVAQLRTVGTDLLLACGRQQREAERTVKKAASRPRGPASAPEGAPAQPDPGSAPGV